MKIAISIFFGVIASLWVNSASAALFSQMINFGDSLSDVGNVYAFTLGAVPGGPGYSNGRFSNGPIWIDRLSQSLGLGTVTPSFSGGNDYAYGGVTSGTGFTNRFFPNVQQQVNGWTAAHAGTSAQLFTVLGGANDLFNLLDSSGTTSPTAAADNIAASVHTLYTDGARNILVSNLPDLGLTPKYRGSGSQSAATADTIAFNDKLALDLAAQLPGSPGLNLYNLDLFGLINAANNNPAQFGLTDAQHSAYTGDSSYIGNGTAVTDPSGYLFWDAIHPTTTGHALIANAALTAIPEPTGMLVVIAGLSILQLRRGRKAKLGQQLP